MAEEKIKLTLGGTYTAGDVKRILKARRTRWPRPVGAKHLVRRRGNVVYFAAMAKERIGHGDKM